MAKTPQSRKVERVCETCTTTFLHYMSQGAGRFCSKTCRHKWQSKRMTGQNNPNYIDGRTPLVKRLRNSNKYQVWRKQVFERDNYVCQGCEDTTKHNLNAHHIVPVAKNIELIFDTDNGTTLCEDCHNIIPKRYSQDVVFMPTRLYREIMGAVYGS